MARSEVYAQHDIRTRRVSIVIYREVMDPDGRMRGQSLCWGEPEWRFPDDERLGAPVEYSLEIDKHHMEEIFTCLWRDGMRPEGWMETVPTVPTHDLERLSAENERLRYDLNRERAMHSNTAKRLDRALELAGMEKAKRRVTVKRGGTEDGETEET